MRNYSLDLTASLSPKACSVKDMAQVAAPQLVAAALYNSGAARYAPEGWIDTVGGRIEEEVHEYWYNEAWSSFKQWASDMNVFYNADIAREVLRDLYDASLCMANECSCDDTASMIVDLYQGNPEPMIAHWKRLHQPAVLEGEPA